MKPTSPTPPNPTPSRPALLGLAALLLLLLFAGGLLLGPGLSAQPTATPRTPAPAPATAARPGPTATPVKRLDPPPGQVIDVSVEELPPGPARPGEPVLSLRLDIRDAVTGQPVRADVWVQAQFGQETRERLVMENSSRVEFPLDKERGADMVVVAIQAEGYQPWTMGIRHQVKQNRLLPLSVVLEPLRRSEGSG